MRERRYEGDIRLRSPPAPPPRSRIRDREYPPTHGCENGGLRYSRELERTTRTERGSGSIERRDYEGRFDERDRDRQLRKLSDFNEGLSRGDSTSMKFQWKPLLDEHKRPSSDASHGSKDFTDYGVSATRVSTERSYHGRQYLDTARSGLLVDKPKPVECERVRDYSHYRPDVGGSKTSGHNDGSFSLPSRDFNVGFHKDEYLGYGDHPSLDKRASVKPMARELHKEEEKSMLYTKGVSDYMISSSRSKVYAYESSGFSKNDFPGSFNEGVPVHSDGLRLRGGMIDTPIGSDGYIPKSRTRSPAEPVVRGNDTRNYSRLYLSSPTEGKQGDYIYPEVRRSETCERSGRGRMSDELYGKVISTGEDYGRRDLLRTSVVDPIINRIDKRSHKEYFRETGQWDYYPSLQEQPSPDYVNASRSLCQRKKDEEILGSRSTHLVYEREIYRDHESLYSGNIHGYERDGGPWSHEERLEMLPTIEYDPCLDGIDGSPEETAGDFSLHEHSKMMLKRKHGMYRKLNRHNFESKISNKGRTALKIRDQADAEDMDSLLLSKKSRFSYSLHGRTGRISNEMAGHEISNPGNQLASMSRRLSKPNKAGGRDIKKRLGPSPQNVHISHPSVKKHKPFVKKRIGAGPRKVHVSLPWLKNYIPKIQDDNDGTLHDQDGEPMEYNITPSKVEPPESSEDFKQLVHSAFFKFVKQLNENSAKRRRFLEQGKAGNLRCSICGSDSEEFVDTESLVMHAFTCLKVECRSQHLGFFKALCVLMGWRSAVSSNGPWVREILSDVESLALKEDLIIWPPVVIIHNSSIGSTNPHERMIVSIEALEAILRGMGFGEKTKVCRGKPANQSIMIVRFNGTLSGLQEAERLHKIYAVTKHGRAEFQQINANISSCSGETQKTTAENVEDVLYGYLGIAEDLNKLEFETKKRCLVKSKKELQDIADASVKTE